MSRSPAPPTLGECIRHRRGQLQLSQAKAARLAGVARSTWIRWEEGALPEEANVARIEKVLQWTPGSVADVLAGRPPSTLGAGLATVTPLRPAAQLPPDEAELAREWRDMSLPEVFIAELIDAYRAEKAGVRERFRHRAQSAPREAGS